MTGGSEGYLCQGIPITEQAKEAWLPFMRTAGVEPKANGSPHGTHHANGGS